MKKKTIAVLVATTLIVTSLVGLTGCSKSGDKPNDTKTVAEFTGTKIFRETGSKVTTLNPHVSQRGEEASMRGWLVSGFLKYAVNEKKEPQRYPAMAKEAFAYNSDCSVVTVKLRENLKFADGTPIDAETYMYSFKALLDPTMKNFNANDFFGDMGIKGAKVYFEGKGKWEDVGVKAKDKYTLEFSLDQPYTERMAQEYVNGLAFNLVNPKLYEKCLDKEKRTTTYGTSLETMKDGCYGPYKMVEWNFDQLYKFEKNKDYPLADKYTTDVISGRVVEESSVNLQLFEKDEVDYASVATASYEKYKEDPRIKLVPQNSVAQTYVNAKSKTAPVLGDINMRKALFFGVDREGIAKGILKAAIPAPYLIARKYYVEDKAGKRTSYRDLAESKAVVPKNNGFDKVLAKEYFDKAYAANGNKKIVLTENYIENEESKTVAQFKKNTYENIFGADKFEYKLQALPSQVWQKALIERTYEITGCMRGGANFFDPVGVMASYKVKDNPYKLDTYESKEFEELYERCTKGDLMRDEKGKIEAAQKLEKMLIDNADIIPSYEYTGMFVFSDKLIVPLEKSDPDVGFGLHQSIYTR